MKDENDKKKKAQKYKYIKMDRRTIQNKALESLAKTTILRKRLTKHELKYIGIALYLCHGSLTERSIRFNAKNDEILQIMVKFLTYICHIPSDKLRVKYKPSGTKTIRVYHREALSRLKGWITGLKSSLLKFNG